MKIRYGNRLVEYIKLGVGFYIGYTAAKVIDSELGKVIKPIIEKIKERI